MERKREREGEGERRGRKERLDNVGERERKENCCWNGVDSGERIDLLSITLVFGEKDGRERETLSERERLFQREREEEGNSGQRNVVLA